VGLPGMDLRIHLEMKRATAAAHARPATEPSEPPPALAADRPRRRKVKRPPLPSFLPDYDEPPDPTAEGPPPTTCKDASQGVAHMSRELLEDLGLLAPTSVEVERSEAPSPIGSALLKKKIAFPDRRAVVRQLGETLAGQVHAMAAQDVFQAPHQAHADDQTAVELPSAPLAEVPLAASDRSELGATTALASCTAIHDATLQDEPEVETLKGTATPLLPPPSRNRNWSQRCRALLSTLFHSVLGGWRSLTAQLCAPRLSLVSRSAGRLHRG